MRCVDVSHSVFVCKVLSVFLTCPCTLPPLEMENPEEVLHCLDEFSKLKPKNIPRELEDYLMYVARTGDPVYQWPTVKILFREKLLSVITEFYESSSNNDFASSPNVDPFNYESMKTVLLERLEAFSNAPFTVQRLCELLTTPRKEYNRPDKFMRAIEKNILVVSTREPGGVCRPDSALSEPLPNGVLETSEAATNQSSSSSSNNTANSEESPVPTPSSVAPKDLEEKSENHVVSGPALVEESNHVDVQEPETSMKVSDNAEVSKQEVEEASKNSANDGEESMAPTESTDSVVHEDLKSVAEPSERDDPVESMESVEAPETTEAPEATNVTSTDCTPNSDVGVSLEAAAITVSGSSEIESVPTSSSSSSSEVTSVGNEVLETVLENVSADSVKDKAVTESQSGTKESEDASSSSPSVADQAPSEAIPEPSESTKEPEKLAEVVESAPSLEASTSSESTVSSGQEEQPADSTAHDTIQEKETPPSDASSTESPDEISTSTVCDTKAEEKDLLVGKAEKVECSEAAPVVEKVEAEVKEAVAAKGDVDTTISSTGAAGETGASEGTGAEVEEDMDVDEGSNQASASGTDSESMEVGEDDEPMEVCDDSALEVMTTSPQEPAQ